jgi:NAD(P)-dependent dehydrogenase (short-subunit alcohol dehydrogenase family)
MAPKFSFPTPAYKISKAALNMLTVQYALALAEEGFIFVPLSPGVCQFSTLVFPPLSLSLSLSFSLSLGIVKH